MYRVKRGYSSQKSNPPSRSNRDLRNLVYKAYRDQHVNIGGFYGQENFNLLVRELKLDSTFKLKIKDDLDKYQKEILKVQDQLNCKPQFTNDLEGYLDNLSETRERLLELRKKI